MQSVKLLVAVTVLQCSGCDGAVGLLSSRNVFTVEPLTNHLTDECTLYRRKTPFIELDIHSWA